VVCQAQQPKTGCDGRNALNAFEKGDNMERLAFDWGLWSFGHHVKDSDHITGSPFNR
jgi:hypothetical protein